MQRAPRAKDQEPDAGWDDAGEQARLKAKEEWAAEAVVDSGKAAVGVVDSATCSISPA